MSKIKISLVSLGRLKYPVNMAYLQGWKSRIFTISHDSEILHLPGANGSDWEYTTDQLAGLVHPTHNADFTIAIIGAPIQDNYYMKRVGEKVAVLSLHEMADIVRFSDFSIEHYILRNIYELVVLYVANGKLFPANTYTWVHDDVRGCLFDLNSNKPDIVFSMHRPNLCDACKSRVLSLQIDTDFLPALNNELPRLQKTLYFRISDWVKAHPICALLITLLSGITLNILASIIFKYYVDPMLALVLNE
ncbi:MAG TPA: hypothetical protein V6C52_02470 [Coleofasciculaceae cyanobacterium]|jgi:hypothetical protein